jgi:hypothetical protein
MKPSKVEVRSKQDLEGILKKQKARLLSSDHIQQSER